MDKLRVRGGDGASDGGRLTFRGLGLGRARIAGGGDFCWLRELEFSC